LVKIIKIKNKQTKDSCAKEILKNVSLYITCGCKNNLFSFKNEKQIKRVN
jgi:hypothetical protein